MPPQDLSRTTGGEASNVVRERAAVARARMITRQEKENARLAASEIEKHCALDDKSITLLKQAISRLGLSARGYHRILKVARTIADLGATESILAGHVAEAIQYRRF